MGKFLQYYIYNKAGKGKFGQNSVCSEHKTDASPETLHQNCWWCWWHLDLLHWFKIYGISAECVDFDFWWSLIGNGLQLMGLLRVFKSCIHADAHLHKNSQNPRKIGSFERKTRKKLNNVHILSEIDNFFPVLIVSVQNCQPSLSENLGLPCLFSFYLQQDIGCINSLTKNISSFIRLQSFHPSCVHL